MLPSRLSQKKGSSFNLRLPLAQPHFFHPNFLDAPKLVAMEYCYWVCWGSGTKLNQRRFEVNTFPRGKIIICPEPSK